MMDLHHHGPTDSLERLIWLQQTMARLEREAEAEYQRLYFTLRLEQRLDVAQSLGLHSHKKIMAYTRAENESRGRMVRWGDHLG